MVATRATLYQFAPEHCHTDGRCCRSQFLIERREWQYSSPGELEVGGFVDGKIEVICEVQCIRPSVRICLLVCRDVEQREIGERGAAEVRIDRSDCRCGPAGSDRGVRPAWLVPSVGAEAAAYAPVSCGKQSPGQCAGVLLCPMSPPGTYRQLSRCSVMFGVGGRPEVTCTQPKWRH